MTLWTPLPVNLSVDMTMMMMRPPWVSPLSHATNKIFSLPNTKDFNFATEETLLPKPTKLYPREHFLGNKASIMTWKDGNLWKITGLTRNEPENEKSEAIFTILQVLLLPTFPRLFANGWAICSTSSKASLSLSIKALLGVKPSPRGVVVHTSLGVLVVFNNLSN